MSFPIFAFSRRRLLSFAASALVFAACPAFAGDKAPAGKVSVEELMAPNALPDIVEGDAKAPVTIVEYASMTCSHCAAFHKDVYPTLKKDYIDSGKVKFILREFPLDPLAFAAFMIARELGDKRDAAVDLLFAQQKNWAFVDNPIEGLANVLKQTGVGQDKFDAVLKDKALYEKVGAVRTRANEKFGVNSTPTFFVNGDKYTGEISVEDLGKIIAAHTPAK